MPDTAVAARFIGGRSVFFVAEAEESRVDGRDECAECHDGDGDDEDEFHAA